MEREIRYVVLKLTDIEKHLDDHQKSKLKAILFELEAGRSLDGKQPLECVVVESDWPEYELTWQAIEARVDGKTAWTADQYKQRIQMDNYIISTNVLAMVAASCLISRDDSEKANEWLLNGLEGFEGEWPKEDTDLDQWYKQQMVGVEWPRPQE